jgi:antitoxin FitA
MSVAIQIKDVKEEVRDALAARAAARGQSMQIYLRDLLEREFRAERNKRIFDDLVAYRTSDIAVDEVVDLIRRGREGEE